MPHGPGRLQCDPDPPLPGGTPEQPGPRLGPRFGSPVLPRNSAFDDLSRRDVCGAVQLAGTAVGAAFVGVIAACLAIAEATRQLLGGMSLDVLNLHLGSIDLNVAPASRDSCPTAVRLTTG